MVMRSISQEDESLGRNALVRGDILVGLKATLCNNWGC